MNMKSKGNPMTAEDKIIKMLRQVLENQQVILAAQKQGDGFDPVIVNGIAETEALLKQVQPRNPPPRPNDGSEIITGDND